MKKSNKLLLGGFLTVILFVTGIHIALYAKYKTGNYIIYHPKQKEADTLQQQFTNVSLVIIRNLPAATVRFGDRAEVLKEKEGTIRCEQKGDSLIITGKSYYDDQFEVNPPVNIILPYNVTIETDSISRITLQSDQLLKAKITTSANNP
jgi:hypothetical protein